MVQCRFDKVNKNGLRVLRRTLQFRVELSGDKKGMLRNLNNLCQATLGIDSTHVEACRLQFVGNGLLPCLYRLQIICLPYI